MLNDKFFFAISSRKFKEPVEISENSLITTIFLCVSFSGMTFALTF
jgi:hypothetical protein